MNTNRLRNFVRSRLSRNRIIDGSRKEQPDLLDEAGERFPWKALLAPTSAGPAEDDASELLAEEEHRSVFVAHELEGVSSRRKPSAETG